MSALVASAVTPDALKAKDDAFLLKRVEAELLSALEAVCQLAGLSAAGGPETVYVEGSSYR